MSAWCRRIPARVWGWTLAEQLLQDLRYAARTILRNPAFTLLAALSLALGIGANTAIYSFMDALLMRSLPVADPASLVVLNWHVTGKKSVRKSVVHDVQRLRFMTIPRPARRPRFFRTRRSSCCANPMMCFPLSSPTTRLEN